LCAITPSSGTARAKPPPFATREEAQQYADSEAAAARELFPDDHVNLHVTIFPKLQSMRQRLIVRPTDE
jgi:hypothetical protein